MDHAQTTHGKDPLVAALPPATDYITYLTLLEYQLNTSNLATLNRLLSEDDGTLAAEIGWDLLKLVLPMLQVVPEEASKCFEIIARRGNPREVIVRVAEELDRLGQHDASSSEDEDNEDHLRTFANEAERIHLGEMKLEGMPEKPTTKAEITASEKVEASDAEPGSDNGLSLSALLSMLSILHPRIKTEFPSRFLATSLPAALGAYRRLPITNDTTSAFMTFLAKLSGKQRPALPPRISTTGSAASLQISAAAPNSSAPLPDPEAKTDKKPAGNMPSESEKSIIQRLLQAVTLELLDEYTNSLLAQDVTQLQWTARFRERFEPGRVVVGRPTLAQQWTDDAELKVREQVVQKIMRLSKDLELEVSKELRKSLTSSSVQESDTEEPSDSEYPQSPSDIPFPLPGLMLLEAAQRFYRPSAERDIDLASLLQLLDDSDAWSLTHSPALADATLSIIYAAIKNTPDTTKPRFESVAALRNLQQLFISSPDPLIRDNAHHIATLLLHDFTTYDSKIFLIISLLRTESGEQDIISLSSIQAGNSKSIAVNWLKDEFLSAAAAPEHLPHEYLDPGILTTHPKLAELLFPALPALPGPFISSHPPATGDSSTAMSTESDLESFLLHIPFYISSLNLVTILSSFNCHQDQEGNATQSEASNLNEGILPPPRSSRRVSVAISEPDGTPLLSGSLLSMVRDFVNTLHEWQEGLLVLLSARRGGADEQGPISPGDLYALEDAVTRAAGAIRHLAEG